MEGQEENVVEELKRLHGRLTAWEHNTPSGSVEGPLPKESIVKPTIVAISPSGNGKSTSIVVCSMTIRFDSIRFDTNRKIFGVAAHSSDLV